MEEGIMIILSGVVFVLLFGVLIFSFVALRKEAPLRVKYNGVFTGNKANNTVSCMGAGLVLTIAFAFVFIFMPEEVQELGQYAWLILLVGPLIFLVGVLMLLGVKKRCPAELRKGLVWNLVLVAFGFNMRKIMSSMHMADSPKEAYAKAEMQAKMEKQNTY